MPPHVSPLLSWMLVVMTILMSFYLAMILARLTELLDTIKDHQMPKAHKLTRKELLSVPCLVCNAPPGEPCHSPVENAEPVPWAHIIREEDAEKSR